MSIWASQNVAGEDGNGKFDGTVVSYIDGWSNHYPGDFPPHKEDQPYQRRSPVNDLNEETPASISTAWLPPWCVPGHDKTGLDIDTHVGPWLRLDLYMATVSIWAGVEIGNYDTPSICLNETAVEKLRDNLNAWLDREKIHPKTEDNHGRHRN